MKRHLKLNNKLTALVQKHSNKDYAVYFDNEFKNFVVKRKNKIFYEIETGKPFSITQFKKNLWKIKNQDARRTIREIEAEKAYKQAKHKEKVRDIAREIATDVYHIAGKKRVSVNL